MEWESPGTYEFALSTKPLKMYAVKLLKASAMAPKNVPHQRYFLNGFIENQKKANGVLGISVAALFSTVIPILNLFRKLLQFFYIFLNRF